MNAVAQTKTIDEIAAQIMFNSPDAVKARLQAAEARIVELERLVAKKDAEIDAIHEDLDIAQHAVLAITRVMKKYGREHEEFLHTHEAV